MIASPLAYIPCPPLNDFVALFWLESRQTPHSRERVLPDGSFTLIFNLAEDHLPIFERQSATCWQEARGSILIGAHSEFLVIDNSRPETILGVQFKPGGAFPFFPAGELHNLTLPLADLWGWLADEIRCQLIEAPTPLAKFQTLERFLLRQAIQNFTRHRAVTFAVDEFQQGALSVGAITEQIGLSATRFIQVFREQVGVTPKLYARLQRFQAVIHEIEQGQALDWVEIALRCGYFDQAHFIRDFQAFAGLNPTEYWVQRGERLNHVPIIEAGV